VLRLSRSCVISQLHPGYPKALISMSIDLPQFDGHSEKRKSKRGRSQPVEKGGKRKRRRFSAEYKAETVQLVQRSGKSIGQIALELGIGETALRRWVEQAEVEAGRGPEGVLKCSEREELVELRRENRRLRLEREILKKATAFFAKESE